MLTTSLYSSMTRRPRSSVSVYREHVGFGFVWPISLARCFQCLNAPMLAPPSTEFGGRGATPVRPPRANGFRIRRVPVDEASRRSRRSRRSRPTSPRQNDAQTTYKETVLDTATRCMVVSACAPRRCGLRMRRGVHFLESQ